MCGTGQVALWQICVCVWCVKNFDLKGEQQSLSRRVQVWAWGRRTEFRQKREPQVWGLSREQSSDRDGSSWACCKDGAAWASGQEAEELGKFQPQQLWKMKRPSTERTGGADWKVMITRKIHEGTQREKHTSCCVIDHIVDFKLMTLFHWVYYSCQSGITSVLPGLQLSVRKRRSHCLFSTGKNQDIVPDLPNIFLSFFCIYPPLLICHCLLIGHCGECKNTLKGLIASGKKTQRLSHPAKWSQYEQATSRRKEHNTKFESERQWMTYLQYEVFYFYNEIEDDNLYPQITIEIEKLACNHGYDLSTNWWNWDFPVLFCKLCSGVRWRKLQTCQQWLSGYSNPQNVLGKSKI